jgi:hypothetical protein
VSHDAGWLIYGSGLSALVLAERLGSAGRRVMLVNPEKHWGGIFRGLKFDGDLFDAGMTNFEFDLFGEASHDILNYDPDRKQDVGRYVHFVRQYLSRFVEVAPLPTPSMQFAGHVLEDMVISNRFEVLSVLPAHIRDAIRNELTEIVSRPNPLHPRTKNDSDSLLAVTSFEKVSLANHGPTFHGLFIEPMFRKILGIPTAEIEGIFHRNGWAPLFYPESLLSQFSPSPQCLKPTIFSYPRDIHFGAFIERIEHAVRGMANVKVVDSAKNVALDLQRSSMRIDDVEFSFSNLAWGAQLSVLLGISGEGQSLGRRASLDLFFLKVRDCGVKNRFGVLVDPEESSPFYRVTNQSMCFGEPCAEHKIILECNSSNFQSSSYESQDVNVAMNTALQKYGIDPIAVTSVHHRTFKGALAIPSSASMAQFNGLRDRIAHELPKVELIGASSGYVSVTLNDHIIQALKVACKEGVLK